jgi:hypothetical protein
MSPYPILLHTLAVQSAAVPEVLPCAASAEQFEPHYRYNGPLRASPAAPAAIARRPARHANGQQSADNLHPGRLR